MTMIQLHLFDDTSLPNCSIPYYAASPGPVSNWIIWSPSATLLNSKHRPIGKSGSHWPPTKIGIVVLRAGRGRGCANRNKKSRSTMDRLFYYRRTIPPKPFAFNRAHSARALQLYPAQCPSAHTPMKPMPLANLIMCTLPKNAPPQSRNRPCYPDL